MVGSVGNVPGSSFPIWVSFQQVLCVFYNLQFFCSLLLSLPVCLKSGDVHFIVAWLFGFLDFFGGTCCWFDPLCIYTCCSHNADDLPTGNEASRWLMGGADRRAQGQTWGAVQLSRQRRRECSAREVWTREVDQRARLLRFPSSLHIHTQQLYHTYPISIHSFPIRPPPSDDLTRLGQQQHSFRSAMRG
jgi:hypothetical protein